MREGEFTTEKTGHKIHDKIVRYFLRGIGEGIFPAIKARKLGRVRYALPLGME